MGHEPLTKYIVAFVVFLQFGTAFYLRNTRLNSPLFVFLAYAIGGTANHNLFLAIHEITHNLAFRGIALNKLLAIFANLPIAIPYSAAFKVGPHARTFEYLLLTTTGLSYRTSQVPRPGWNRHRPAHTSRTVMS